MLTDGYTLGKSVQAQIELASLQTGLAIVLPIQFQKPEPILLSSKTTMTPACPAR
jgi:hypothetical protein